MVSRNDGSAFDPIQRILSRSCEIPISPRIPVVAPMWDGVIESMHRIDRLECCGSIVKVHTPIVDALLCRTVPRLFTSIWSGFGGPELLKTAHVVDEPVGLVRHALVLQIGDHLTHRDEPMRPWSVDEVWFRPVEGSVVYAKCTVSYA